MLCQHSLLAGAEPGRVCLRAAADHPAHRGGGGHTSPVVRHQAARALSHARGCAVLGNLRKHEAVSVGVRVLVDTASYICCACTLQEGGTDTLSKLTLYTSSSVAFEALPSWVPGPGGIVISRLPPNPRTCTMR